MSNFPTKIAIRFDNWINGRIILFLHEGIGIRKAAHINRIFFLSVVACIFTIVWMKRCQYIRVF